MSRVTSGIPSGNGTSSSDGATKTAGALNILAGIWLIISGFVLGYSSHPLPLWNGIVLGVIVIAVAWIRLGNFGSIAGIAWVNLIAGIWLFFSPWILRFAEQSAAVGNSLILGIIVFALSIWGLATSRQSHAMG